MSGDATWTGSMPELYDRLMGPLTFQPWADRLASMAHVLRPERVLELAAGTGIVAAALVEAMPSAAVTATDLNEAMVDFGRDHVPGASWQVADAQDIPLPDASFDLVVCAFGAMFFPDKLRAFREMERVLVPGGRCLLSIWDVLEASDFEAALTDCLARVFPDDPPSFLARVPHGYADPDQITADLTAAGLEVQSIDRVVEPTSAPSARAIAEGYCQGSPLRFELEARGSLPDLTDVVAHALTEQLGEGPLTGSMAALLVTVRKP